jgi:catechol 2,3-dioxygenase-like lactoylglutathione lyase family enzyme
VIRGVHHVGITVRDLERSLTFYRDVLGFEVLVHRQGVEAPHVRTLVGYPDAVLDVARLATPGGGQLELTQFVVPQGAVAEVAPADIGAMHLALEVDDLTAVHQRLRDRGARFTSDPVIAPDGPAAGTRFVYCTDPDGAQLELVQPPAA